MNLIFLCGFEFYQIINTVTFGIVERPGEPTNFKLDSNAACVFLSAEEPDNSNGDITHYKVRVLCIVKT